MKQQWILKVIFSFMKHVLKCTRVKHRDTTLPRNSNCESKKRRWAQKWGWRREWEWGLYEQVLRTSTYCAEMSRAELSVNLVLHSNQGLHRDWVPHFYRKGVAVQMIKSTEISWFWSSITNISIFCSIWIWFHTKRKFLD